MTSLPPCSKDTLLSFFRQLFSPGQVRWKGHGFPEDILLSINHLPGVALKEKARSPMALPSPEVLDKAIGYNWIAIDTKK
jgi:hypothetical protein